MYLYNGSLDRPLPPPFQGLEGEGEHDRRVDGRGSPFPVADRDRMYAKSLGKLTLTEAQVLTPEGEGGGGHATLSCSMRM